MILESFNGPPRVSVTELMQSFLTLGCTAFGGPAVHLALFNQWFVQQPDVKKNRNWMTAETFAELVSFASVLPGPTSTQVSFLIGMYLFSVDDPNMSSAPKSKTMPLLLHTQHPQQKQEKDRKWFIGGLLAGTTFILPGFLFMTLSAQLGVQYGMLIVSSNPCSGAILGMASVGWGLIGTASHKMASTVTGGVTWKQITCAMSMIIVLISYPTPAVKFVFPIVILMGGIAGLIMGIDNPVGNGTQRADGALEVVNSQQQPARVVNIIKAGARLEGIAIGMLWSLLLVVSLFQDLIFGPFVPVVHQIFSQFYLVGALVFGGGPVVLPMLDKILVDDRHWLTSTEFLTGLSLGQAIPGPMFNLGTFLGGLCARTDPLQGSIAGCFGIFTPGVLLAFALFPFWSQFRAKSSAYQKMVPGLNAAAVGLIAASVFVVYAQLINRFQSQQTVFGDSEPYLVGAIAVFGQILIQVLNFPVPLAILSGGLAGLLVSLPMN